MGGASWGGKGHHGGPSWGGIMGGHHGGVSWGGIMGGHHGGASWGDSAEFPSPHVQFLQMWTQQTSVFSGHMVPDGCGERRWYKGSIM
uniref:Uncharacterized protein n=1 Tax=Knipowitschia caucasica TaxID=637954 RepID=A0AAV2KY23_KNICA